MRILISSGEPSGEALAAAFEAELAALGRRREVVRVGELVRLEPVLGFVEGLRWAGELAPALRRVEAEVARLRPDVAVLFSYSGFNLSLGRRLRRQGVPVLFIGPPQVWAWGGWRARRLARAADEVVCLFDFEEPLLRRAGVNARYHGWPLLDAVVSSAGRAETLARLGLGPGVRYVLALPGSRPAERRYHEPLFAKVAEMVEAEDRGGGTAGRRLTERPASVRLRVVMESGQGARYQLMRHAECALAVSGTVTAELLALGTPMVVTYHLPSLSRLAARLLVRSRWFALPNIVAGAPVVPELLSPSAVRLARAVGELLRDPGSRSRLDLARRRLGPRGGMRAAAEAALRLAARGQSA